jgi:hypothetical protein
MVSVERDFFRKFFENRTKKCRAQHEKSAYVKSEYFRINDIGAYRAGSSGPSALAQKVIKKSSLLLF